MKIIREAQRCQRARMRGPYDLRPPIAFLRGPWLVLGILLLLSLRTIFTSGVAAASKGGAGPPTFDLDAVPEVDRSRRGVPLDEVVFDTFDGGFVRLSGAPKGLIRSLRDAIRPIYAPTYSKPGGVRSLPWLRDDDLIIGFAPQAGAYAYPLKILNYREIVNDAIGGVPVLVSYCPLCGSGVVFSRRLDGRTLLFGNTSALYHSDLVMYDHQTGSYWFQVGGEAIVGRLTGRRLRVLPSMTMPWREWKRHYPNTRLLVGEGGKVFGTRYASDPFQGYGRRLDEGRFVFPVSREKLDGRLRAAEIVITAEVNSAKKAYPVRLIGERAVNDRVGGQPVVIFSLGFTGAAYLATVSDRTLTFQFRQGRFGDQETGSAWNYAGRAVAGKLRGTRLIPVPSRRAFWFSVARMLPALELYHPSLTPERESGQ
ncbi:MAG: DUF3179 domain-containing protein [Nitrospinota bacterium]